MAPQQTDGQQNIRTVVLFDTETTGLPSPGNNPRITELCFLALTREELMPGSGTRALCKLVLCFNPEKMLGLTSSKITGLHNDSLELLPSFKKQASLVARFLENLPKPICLVAHNGHGFDYPLLVSEMRRAKEDIPDGVLCVDSLEAFRVFDGLTPVPEHVVAKRQKNITRGKLESHRGVCNDMPGRMLQQDSQKCLKDDEKETGVSETRQSGAQRGNALCNSVLDAEMINDVSTLSDKSSYRNQQNSPVSEGGKRLSGATRCSSNIKSPRLSTTSEEVWRYGEVTPSKGVSLVDPWVKMKHPVKAHEPESIPGDVRRSLFTVKSEHQLSLESDGDALISSCESSLCPTAVHGECHSVFDVSASRQLSGKIKTLADDEPFQSASSPKNFEIVNELTDSEREMVEAAKTAEVTHQLSKKNIQEDQESKDLMAGGSSMAYTGDSGSAAVKAASSSRPVGRIAKGTNGGGSHGNTGKGTGVQGPRPAPPVSYKLASVYARAFGQSPVDEHTAEGDCKTMLSLIHLKSKMFLPWCDENAVPLKDVTPMY